MFREPRRREYQFLTANHPFSYGSNSNKALTSKKK